MNLKFLKYAQSNQCNNMNDSSVSYASASLVLEWYSIHFYCYSEDLQKESTKKKKKKKKKRQ